MENIIEGLGIFLFYDLIFLACLTLAAIFEHIDKVQARKRFRARRKEKVRQANLIKMVFRLGEIISQK